MKINNYTQSYNYSLATQQYNKNSDIIIQTFHNKKCDFTEEKKCEENIIKEDYNETIRNYFKN